MSETGKVLTYEAFKVKYVGKNLFVSYVVASGDALPYVEYVLITQDESNIRVEASGHGVTMFPMIFNKDIAVFNEKDGRITITQEEEMAVKSFAFNIRNE